MYAFISLVYFSSKILLLAEVVNHRRLSEVPSVPCACWSGFVCVSFCLVFEPKLSSGCCAAALAVLDVGTT